MTPEEQLLNMSNLSPEERRFLQDSFKPQSSMPQGLMTDKDYSRIMPTGSPQQGLLSRIRGGLLDAGQAVGSGLLGAGRAAVAGIDPKQMSRDIIDTQRFYRQAQMSQPSMVLGSDLAKLQNITPQGIAASLPALRAQEQLALQKPEIEKLEALAALERAKGTGSLASLTTSPQPYLYIDEEGNKKVIETFFDKGTRQRLVSGTNEPVPEGAMPLSTIESPSISYLSGLEKSVFEDQSRLIALDSYLNEVKGSRQGIFNLMDRASKEIKTLISDGKLTEAELATAKGQAKLQGLLGRFRIIIVGGGVMTEQDALRILSALGGNFDAFQNKEVTKELISELRDQTLSRFNRQSETFNRAVGSLPDVSYAKSIYRTVGPYTGLGDKKSDDGSGITPEMRKKYNLE